MTMVELIVTLAILTGLMLFVAPRMQSADTLGMDAQAKASLSTVADAVATVYAQQATGQVWDPEKFHEAEQQAELDKGRALTAGDYEELPRTPPQPQVSETVLRTANPDLVVVNGQQASARVSEVSVGARLIGTSATNQHWRVGLAVKASADDTAAKPSCWLVQMALLGPTSTAPETYLLYQLSSDSEGSRCTGAAAAAMDVAEVAAHPDNALDASQLAAGAPARGTVWAAPLFVTDAHAAAAVAEASN